MIANIPTWHQLRKRLGITSDLNPLFTSSFLVLITMVVGKGLSFIWKIMLARLGPDVIGHTQLVLTFVGLVSSFVILGFPAVITRYVALNRAQKQISQNQLLLAVLLKYLGIASVILAASMPLLLPIFEQVTDFRLTHESTDYLILIGLPIVVVSEIIWAYHNGQQQVLRYGLGKFVFQPLFRLILLILFGSLGITSGQIVVWHLLGALILSGGLGLLLSWSSLKMVATASLKDIPRTLIRYALPVNLSAVAFMIFGSIDVFLLNRFTTVETIGVFAVLILLAELMDILFLPILNLLPTFLSDYHQSIRQGRAFVVKVILLLGVAGTGFGLLLFGTKDWLIRWLFGQEYSLALGLVGLALTSKILESVVVMPLRHFLDFYGFVKQTFGLMLVMVLLKIVVSSIFISRWGLSGAFIGQIGVQVSHAMACILLTLIISRIKLKLNESTNR